MRLRALALFALAAPALAAATDDYNAIFERAVQAVDFDFEESWAYTETQVTSEAVLVGRYDPRREEGDRWQLLTVDGREPTQEEREDYDRDKDHDHSRGGDERIDSMVAPETLRLVEDAADYWILGFDADDEDIMDSVDATMRIDKATGHLEYIEIRNHETIRPGFTVKLTKLLTRLSFGPAVEEGPIVPLSVQVEVEGRAFLVASFDEQEIVRNSDFEHVGDELSGAAAE